MDKTKLSFLIGLGAFLAWGSLPLFWQLMFYLPPADIVSYRILCSLIFVTLLTTVTGRWKLLLSLFKNPRTVTILFTCGVLVGINWFLFILSISSNHVMQTSMGYYINPLMNALLGAFLFKEKMRPLQKVAILFAAAGVVYMVVSYGKIPFFALALAGTFALYGAVHKLTKVNVADGMFYEMLILAVPALIYMFTRGSIPFTAEPLNHKIIISLAGVFTALPLIGFAYSVQNLKLATVGMVQYISPTATFLLSIFFFKEEFTTHTAVIFIFIWIGVLIYTFDAVKNSKK